MNVEVFTLPEHIKHRMTPHRGRQSPPVETYACTGCRYDKPTLRKTERCGESQLEHVRCSQPNCGAAPNPQLALLWNQPDWPLITVPPSAA
jgi:hypothetical protein